MTDWRLRKKQTQALARQGLELINEHLPAGPVRAYIASLLFPKIGTEPGRGEDKQKDKTGFKTIKTKLDTVFSDFIRIRDADDQGICKCITCPRFYHWKEMDCGHFIDRDQLATRWEPKNCAAQCRYCNRMKTGRRFEFGKALDKRYGLGTTDKLQVQAAQGGYKTRAMAPVLLKAWQINLKVMKEKKGL